MFWNNLQESRGCSVCHSFSYGAWNIKEGSSCWGKNLSARMSDAWVNCCSNRYGCVCPVSLPSDNHTFCFDCVTAVLRPCFSPYPPVSRYPSQWCVSEANCQGAPHLPRLALIPLFSPHNFLVSCGEIDQWAYLCVYLGGVQSWFSLSCPLAAWPPFCLLVGPESLSVHPSLESANSDLCALSFLLSPCCPWVHKKLLNILHKALALCIMEGGVGGGGLG